MNEHQDQPGQVPIPNEIIYKLLRELSTATVALRTLIEKQYPTRREMEEQFLRKEVAGRRMRALITTTVIAAAITFVGTFAGTAATVSTCFLGEPGSSHPAVCNFLPGYQEAQDRTAQYDQLLKDYDKRLTRLERKK